MSKIVICSVGNDPYDHAEKVTHEIVSPQSWGDTGGEQLRQYNEHYQLRMKKGMYAWVTINELDTDTGVTKCWLRLKNEVKKRIEVNLAAKELKIAKVVKKRNYDDFLASYDTTATTGGASFFNTPVPVPPTVSMDYEAAPQPEGTSW